MWKISSQVDGGWTDYVHQDTFQHELAGATERLVIAPSADPLGVARALVQELSSPVFLLWVLHTPRGGSRIGRYQSPPLQVTDADALLGRFAAFFEEDARSDIWVHSVAPAATIVFERHNLIYAYGDLPRFTAELIRRGMQKGKVHIPSPHAHNYHPDHDASEREFAASQSWSITSLRSGDEQSLR
ncbi:MAG TPA: hypothetical protein VLV78_07200 [Thermoanaerobaculia bacterium]|nr:hypothetical protein [Thermoanaerobaculia bacterium]